MQANSQPCLENCKTAVPSSRNAAECSDHAGKDHVLLELPVLVHRLDSPIELLPQGFGEELFDWHVEFLGEDDSQAGIDVVLRAWVSEESS